MQVELNLCTAAISNYMAKLGAKSSERLCGPGRRGLSLAKGGTRISEASPSLFRSDDDFGGIIGSVDGERTGQVYFGSVRDTCEPLRTDIYSRQKKEPLTLSGCGGQRPQEIQVSLHQDMNEASIP